MSTYNYSNVYNTASRLITKFGAEFSHKRIDSSYTKSFNPRTSKDEWVSSTGVTLTEAPYTTTKADGVVVGFNDKDRFGTALKQGDRQLLAVTISTPTHGDIFTIGQVDYSYVNHETIRPASTFKPILYKIQVRV